MNSGHFWKGLLVALAATLVVVSLPDIKRYIKISSM
jgi:hypothetical protein